MADERVLLVQHVLLWAAVGFSLAALIAVAFVWSHRRSERMVAEWARRNGMELLAMDARSITGGPFLLTTLTGQTVYRVTILDPHRGARRAWARCGIPLGGLLVERVEVYWDDSSP